MDNETKSNIKIGVIVLMVFGLVVFGLYKYNVAHEAEEHGHEHN